MSEQSKKLAAALHKKIASGIERAFNEDEPFTTEDLETIIDQELADLHADKERLDWLEQNNISMNQLQGRDAVKPFWHLYWTPKGGTSCDHFGDPDTALASLREAIDAARKGGGE